MEIFQRMILKYKWYYYVIPFLVISVISLHFYHRQKGLSPWKGGGFGMYSDFYPGREKVFFNDFCVTDSVKKNRSLRIVYHKFIFYPNQKTFNALHKFFPTKTDTVLVRMQSILIEPEPLKLYKTTSYEKTFIAAK